MCRKNRSHHCIRAVAKLALLSVSYVALAAAGASDVRAQSLSVITREFINDTSFQNLTDITRYVPGVAVHQGEGNRDELIIRGVDSSANFYVHGFRDDVQYFPHLSNAQSIE